jgi:hypothetical protein
MGEYAPESSGFELMISAFGNFGDEMKAGHKALGKTLMTPKPIRRPVGNVTVSTGTGAQLITGANMSPGKGRIWFVRRIQLYGSDTHTQVLGSSGVNQITLAATTVAAFNNNPYGVYQTVSGGTVTAIAVNGTSTGMTSGTFYISAGGTITVTYTVAPTTFTTSTSQSGAVGAFADIFAGPGEDILAGTDFQSCFESAFDIPQTQTYAHDRVWLGNDDKIYAYAYGVTAGQQLVLNAWIDEYNEDEMTVNKV